MDINFFNLLVFKFFIGWDEAKVTPDRNTKWHGINIVVKGCMNFLTPGPIKV